VERKFKSKGVQNSSQFLCYTNSFCAKDEIDSLLKAVQNSIEN